MAAPSELSSAIAFDLDLDFARRYLKPCGEVDGVTVLILLDAAKALTAAAVGDLTIDLAGITGADSALVQALVEIRRDLRAQGAGLWLVNEPACVLRLFRVSEYRAVLAQ